MGRQSRAAHGQLGGKTCEFGGEPPVGDVDDLCGIFQRHRDSLSPVSESNSPQSPQGVSYPEIVPTVHIPLRVVPGPHVSETRVPVRVSDEVPPLVNALLVWVVVAVVRIDEVPVLADVVLEVDQLDLEGVQLPVVGMTGGIVDVVRVVLEVGGRRHCDDLFMYLSVCVCVCVCVCVNPAVMGIMVFLLVSLFGANELCVDLKCVEIAGIAQHPWRVTSLLTSAVPGWA